MPPLVSASTSSTAVAMTAAHSTSSRFRPGAADIQRRQTQEPSLQQTHLRLPDLAHRRRDGRARARCRARDIPSALTTATRLRAAKAPAATHRRPGILRPRPRARRPPSPAQPLARRRLERAARDGGGGVFVVAIIIEVKVEGVAQTGSDVDLDVGLLRYSSSSSSNSGRAG